ncbi:MAG: hypothetical protein J0L96_02415 [Anaerolineae bacterium]|nr:hypothetical protein [Anaerolineae bacterium]
MPKSERNLEERKLEETIKAEKKKIAQTTRRRLIVLISFLGAVLLILIFKVGEVYWSVWLIEHRRQAIGIVALLTTIITLSSPIIIEANSNTRTLQGPGKDPKFGDFWTKG